MVYIYQLQIVEETSKGILEKIPPPIPLEPIIEKYPVKYEESMNTVLVQEVGGVEGSTVANYDEVNEAFSSKHMFTAHARCKMHALICACTHTFTCIIAVCTWFAFLFR